MAKFTIDDLMGKQAGTGGGIDDLMAGADDLIKSGKISKPGHSVSDDELSADALKRDNIRQTTGDISGRANDVWQALKSGGAQLIQGAGWLANEAGAHDSGQFLRDIGQIGEDQALANMTPAGREAQKNGVFKEDLSGVNDDWGRGMAQGIAGSAVPSIVGAVLGAPVARGIGAAGNALLGRAAVSEGALGSVLDAAIKYTPAPVMRLAGALPGAVGAGAGEAAVTGATNGAQAYQEVMDAPIESLRKSTVFQSLSKELGSEDAARKAIADRMSIQTAKDTALSTGLIGAAMGGGAVGSLLNKFAVKQGAKEVGSLGAKAAAKEVLKDGTKEFAEEFAQSGPEHYLQNAAKRDYLDPTIDPSTGMLRASLEGGVVGMGQGMGMSGGAHAVNRLLARNEPQPSQPANTPQQQPNTKPAAPESVAGYDPIAPNQQALLQRLGVEPDPAADEAAASVASIFGAGDPTAGLVASVMRGDALQPIHDLAAVRAAQAVPFGSNKGGLYEPQWLPDAASGESSNGMRMPRRGFDSQEQLLANAGMDARDVQRKADIASQVDAAWAQQQNPVQKARELESLAQESAVPVAIDRAEQSNQINQALANAAGEGVAVPNAMQLALQRAQRQGEQAKPEENTQKSAESLIPDSASDVVAQQPITPQHGIAHDGTEQDVADQAPNITDQAPNISKEPALTMQQNERGQWIIKGDMAQHAQTIRDALPGTKLVVSQKSGQALVQMPADKNTGKQGKAIRKALDHLLLSGEQIAARDQQRANASERAKAANRQAQQIDPERDDIVNAVAKLGGIDTEQALSEWWRGQRETVGHYNAEVPGNLRRQGVFAFKRGGMPIDDMIRRLEGEGYLPQGSTPNDLLDAIEQRQLHPAGMERQAQEAFEARQQEEQANAPGEFQQAYDEGRFADEFTKRELEEETDYFELNRQNREAAEDAAATAEAAELDRLIDNAPVIASKSGPVTEEELDAIFGPQSRNTTAESPQADREPAAGRSMEGAESGTATAEAAPEEDGFGLASYTESDLRRQEREAEQRRVEDERQRAAADKARQEEETRKEIRRRSEAAADTFVLGGNAEDNLTGQGGLFDAPAETIHKPINMVSKSDGSGFATRDALRAAATRDGIPQSSLIEKRDEAGNWIGLRYEPDGAIDRIITDQSRAGKVIGTSVRDLHSDDVYTLLMAASSKKQINAIADYIGKYAPRAAADAVKSHIDSVLKQNGWATEEALYGGGLFDAPAESSSAQNTNDEGDIKRGKVGMMLAPGEVVLTTSGRETTPFPKFQTKTGKTTRNHIAEVDKWLLQNAANEALARGDTFNAPVFQRAADNPKNISQSDKDSAEEYLFGEQPAVKPSILKPLSGANNAESQSSSAQNTADNNDNWLNELFGIDGTEPAQQSVQRYTGRPKEVDFSLLVPKIRAFVSERIAEADDWAGRKYKHNKKQIHLDGDGPAKHESISISSANESRRRSTIDNLTHQANAAKSLIDRIERGENISHELAQAIEASDADIETIGKPRFGKTRNDQAEAYISNMLLGDRGYRYGKGTLAHLLLAEYENFASTLAASSAQNTAHSPENTAETPQNAASSAETATAIDALIATGERRRDAGESPRMSREGLAYPPPAGDGDAMSAMNWLSDAERQQLHNLKQSLPSAASEREAAQSRIKQKLERRKLGLNGGAIDSNEPKADYTDYYETDLFGNPLPNAGRKARATKTAQPEVRRNVLAASTVQGDTPAPDGDYKVRTIVGSESQRKLGARSITSVADLAAATSYLYRSAVERFDAIVTDASGKPLAVIGAFKGAVDQTSVYPATLVGEAVRIPGAAHIWFSHNHPGGTAKLSNADQTLYHRLADIFDGSGIKPMGLIAVANRQYASMEDGHLPIPQSSESMSVPVVERELSATDIDMPAITSPQVAKELAGAMYKGSEYQPGMMLLNTQNQVAAWVPLPATAMGALRHSGGLNAIYRAISESNAGAVILVHGGELSERIGSVTLGQNIAAAVAKLDVRPLDIIDIRKPRSAAETGEQIQSGPVYSKANAHTNTQGMSAKDLQDIVAKALPAHLRERVKVAQSRSNTTQQSARSEDNDLIEAEYDPATGRLTLYADAIPTPERALFVLSHELTHYGLAAKYGSGLSSILLEARNNPMIAKLANAIAADRGMTVNSVRQDIADALGVPVARVAHSAAVHRLQVETTNEALAELNAAIERNDFAYLQDRYGVAVPKMMRNDLRGRLARLAASVKAWLAKLTGKQATDYSDKQVWDLLAGVRDVVRSNAATGISGDGGSLSSKASSGNAFVDVDGVKRPTTNSNGQAIHQTEEGLRNFWRWFGRSKVVDAQGRPLVVYHGTAYDFDRFDSGRNRTELNEKYQGDGFHFSPDPRVASRYADADRNRLLRKQDIYPLVEKRFPGRIYKLFKDVVENGYSHAWDVSDDEVRAIIKAGDDAGIDLNSLLDLAEVVEGSRYHAGRADNADPAAVFSAIFGGSTGDFLTEYGINEMVSMGLDAAAPTQNVIPAYLKANNLLVTDSREDARLARSKGYDGVLYSGDDIVDYVHEYVVFDPTQIKSAVGNNGEFDPGKPGLLHSTAPNKPASAGFSLPEETTAQQAQREVQDNMNRWKQVLENVREQGGQVDEQNDVYGAEERFHGRAATRIEDFARDEVEPLMQRLADSGHTLQEVEQYLLAQHAEEANARIREIDDGRDTAFGMEDGEAQSILAKFAALPDAAEFKRLANDFRRISEGTLSLYVKAGIVSPEAAHAMRQAYQFYVPVKGGDEDQAARQGTGKGLSVNGKQKRRMGHDMRDEHVLENMLRDRQRAIVLAEKNNVGTYLLDLIERNPDPKLWTVDVLPKQKVLRDQVSYVVELNGQMLDAFNSLEAARVFIQAEAARTGSKPGAFAVSKSSDPYVTMMAKPTLQDHEVQVYVQGRAVRIQLHDPILAGQYRRMGTEQMGRIIEAGKSLNRWLSKVYTGYNPEFFIKNVVRDLFAGTINLTADQGGRVAAKALSHWPKAGAAMFRFALTGKAPAGEYGKALQRYRAAGGSTGAAYMGDLERQADTLQTLYENYTGAMAAMQEGKPVKAAKIATRKLLGGLAHWFEVWNQAGENAFRLATFMAMENAGKTVAQSASMAKNVTVNFNRKGELTPQLGGLYLFFNPNVQGTARLWQSLAGKDTKHRKQAWALVGSMAGAALAIAMMNRGDDEDEWEAIPDSVKDRNLIIPLGNKRKLTIPLPYGYSFFVSLANRLDAVMHGESAEKASVRLASAVFENFSPVGNPIGDDPKLENTLLLLPTALKIPALPAANMTDFGGPMRPEYREDQPDNEKMWRGTRGSLYDKAAQGLSSLAGSPYEDNFWNDVSPETIKYLVRTLTGGTGSFMADSASLLNVLASGSTPDVSEVPFVRSGMRESTVKDARARFHELGNEAKKHVAAWKRAVDAGDDKAATEYEQDGELMAMGEMLEGYRKQATSLRDLMALEMQREDLTLAEKRMKQKAYENQEAEVYREFIRQFKH